MTNENQNEEKKKVRFRWWVELWDLLYRRCWFEPTCKIMRFIFNRCEEAERSNSEIRKFFWFAVYIFTYAPFGLLRCLDKYCLKKIDSFITSKGIDIYYKDLDNVGNNT